MSLVNIIDMVVLDNPTHVRNPFQFEITFECLQDLEDDLEWKVIYVGSAEDSRHDQILEEVLVGPVPVGVNKFVLQSEPPNFSDIPEDDVLGVTVVLVTCSYKDQEFVRVGYYVNNESCEELSSGEEQEYPSRPLDFSKITRQILSEKPRVTRFPIHWTNSNLTNHEEAVNEKDSKANPLISECDEDILDMEREDDMMEDEEEEDDGDSEDVDIDLEAASGEEEEEDRSSPLEMHSMIVME